MMTGQDNSRQDTQETLTDKFFQTVRYMPTSQHFHLPVLLKYPQGFSLRRQGQPLGHLRRQRNSRKAKFQKRGRMYICKLRIWINPHRKMFPSQVIKFSIPPAPFTALRAAGRSHKANAHHPVAVFPCYAVRTGNPLHPHLQSHPLHGTCRPKARRHGFSADCSGRRRFPCCHWN